MTDGASLSVRVVRGEDGPSQFILSGTIDVYLAGELRNGALDVLHPGRDVSVDLSGVESMDVCGMQVLLALRSDLKSRGAKLAVARASVTLKRCFRIAGISGLLEGVDPPHAGR